MNLMVNNDDREIRITSYRGTYALQSDYSLEYAKVLLRKTFYLFRLVGGLCKGVAACVEKIKKIKFGVIWRLMCNFVAW